MYPLNPCCQKIASMKFVSNFNWGIYLTIFLFRNPLLRHLIILHSHISSHLSLSLYIVEETTEYPDFVETNQISGAGNMLKTLDPILITIIAMSALGVFLGAICGVVLYCACSHGGMSDRNLSALENYNFELVDGVKLKKDKLNVQSSYSEA